LKSSILSRNSNSSRSMLNRRDSVKDSKSRWRFLRPSRPSDCAITFEIGLQALACEDNYFEHECLYPRGIVWIGGCFQACSASLVVRSEKRATAKGRRAARRAEVWPEISKEQHLTSEYSRGARVEVLTDLHHITAS
jgi:hypothetical protein